MKRVKNLNHPKKGSSIRVEPIRDLRAVKRIKASLYARSPRDYCLFVLGINTAYRISELLSLTVSDVAHLKPGDVLNIRQSKTNKYRLATLNTVAYDAIQYWLQRHPQPVAHAALFASNRTGDALLPSTCCNMVKEWCADADIHGNYGSHSLRKTWGFHQRVTYNEPTALISRALGHSSERETQSYLGIQTKEIECLFENMV